MRMRNGRFASITLCPISKNFEHGNIMLLDEEYI